MRNNPAAAKTNADDVAQQHFMANPSTAKECVLRAALKFVRTSFGSHVFALRQVIARSSSGRKLPNENFASEQ